MSEKSWALVIVLVIFCVVVPGLIYLDWLAYFQRFPNAAWWSYFFQGGK